MSLATVITERYERTAAEDPDTIHGLLYIVEQGADQRKICKLVHSRSLDRLFDKARAGLLDKVAAFNGDRPIGEVYDFTEGILPLKWKRDLVAMLLRPDGALTTDILLMLRDCGTPGYDPGKAVSVLRRDLRPFRVVIEAQPSGGGHNYRFRIAGMHAWRMQRIIANGWSV